LTEPSTAPPTDGLGDGFGRLGLKTSMLYGAVYLHFGVFAIFMPVWLKHQGLPDPRIGLLMSLPLVLRILFVAPMSALADHLRRIREVLFVCLALMAALVGSLNLVHGFVPIAIAFVVLSMVWDPIPVLTDSYAVAAVRVRGLDFGRMRLWGSLAHIFANVVGGKLIDLAGIRLVPWMTAALLLVPLAVIPFLPADRRFGAPVPAAKGEWTTLVKDRPLMVVVIATCLILGSQGLFSGFAAIHWTAQGFTGFYIAALNGVGIGAEILILWLCQRLLGARSPLILILVMAGLTVVRWLLMTLDPGPALLIPIQLLQGCGMGVVAGLMLFIAERAPAHLMATAQGLYAVIVGVVAALVVAGSGFLWQALGPRAYLVMALITVVGMVMVAIQLAAFRNGKLAEVVPEARAA
jgi:MFS transporter, PPP family, 3-phenylpropionic acid transporter